jgi:hypothetical protein
VRELMMFTTVRELIDVHDVVRELMSFTTS